MHPFLRVRPVTAYQRPRVFKRTQTPSHQRKLGDRRSDHILREAEDAVERWQRSHAPDSSIREGAAELFQRLPRTPRLVLSRGRPSSMPVPRRDVTFHAGILRSAWRLVVWMAAALRFSMRVLWDVVRGKYSEERCAERLRETFQEMGTTFVKLGQQLSMRLDLLPFTYTRALEKLLDEVKPFSTEEAVKAIQISTGRRLGELFAAFDPKPIGAASMACVYQAVLHDGKRVAVKVRRPNVGLHLAADMRALSWILNVVEIAFLAPGFTRNFAFELTTMLTEELDFVREARFTDLYRKAVRDAPGMRFVTAPRVYFEYSTEDVLVTEFVTGVSLADILLALETDDPAALQKLREMGFDRVKMARRIQLIARFNNFENTFFHADLHPANMLIQENNRIVLIDFGSCGSFNQKELNSWRRWFDAQSVDDIGGMVQAALGILEPLPPVDKFAFGQRLEMMFWGDVHAIKSKHSGWSERMTSRMWIGFLRLCREFMIPLRLNTLRMIRASMLTDTIASRLDHDLDPYREFRRYEKAAGRRAKKHVRKRLCQLSGPSKFIRIQYGIESAIKLVYHVQRLVDSVRWIDFGVVIAKIDYFLTLMMRHLTWSVVTLALFSVYYMEAGLVHVQRGEAISYLGAVLQVLKTSTGWWSLCILPIPFILWRLYFRLQQPRSWDS